MIKPTKTKKEMTTEDQKDEMQYVLSVIKDEGFDYTFVSRSEFEEIENEEFHRLRKAYLAARNELMWYIDRFED